MIRKIQRFINLAKEILASIDMNLLHRIIPQDLGIERIEVLKRISTATIKTKNHSKCKSFDYVATKISEGYEGTPRQKSRFQTPTTYKKKIR